MIEQCDAVLLIDPSRFTVPYDAELSRGLAKSGIKSIWATRPARPFELEEFDLEKKEEVFYLKFDRPKALPQVLHKPFKALAHIAGLWRAYRLARAYRVKVIHFQWTVLPLIDALAIALMGRWCPIFLTVHDSVPFNGQRMSLFQTMAFDWPIKCATRVIVHTERAKDTLIKRGVKGSKIIVIPHGPLKLKCAAAPGIARDRADWTFVMFGQLKPYKGVDVLVNAIASAQADLAGKARIIIAGAPRMDMNAIESGILEVTQDDLIDLRLSYQSNDDLAALLYEADCFVFPYRQIDASGAFYLARSFNKWVIASKVGIFCDEIRDGKNGTLVLPEDVSALADALVEVASTRPKPSKDDHRISWDEIGARTAAEYSRVLRRDIGKKWPCLALSDAVLPHD
jgi:glycosyltransferase involved in cell wall biosynthesis